jgi:LuxR family maltose regulon positive regulatory protein
MASMVAPDLRYWVSPGSDFSGTHDKPSLLALLPAIFGAQAGPTRVVHALATPVVGWLAATQARLGMPDEARATLTGFSAEHERVGFIYNARAVICLAEGDLGTALGRLQDVRDARPPVGVPGFTLVESHLLPGTAQSLYLGDRHAAAASAEAALAAAEPDRLNFPFALTEAAELLDALPRHETAHGALLADIVDLLAGASAPGPDREHYRSRRTSAVYCDICRQT